MRQKSEHILEALRQAVELLSGPASEEEFRVQAAAVDQMLAVQEGQFELIRNELATAHGRLGAAFGNLAGESAKLSASLGNWKGGTDPLGPFRTNLSQLECLNDRSRGLQQKTRETAQRAIDSSDQLATYVAELKGINQDMHLQALNAIVKTAALGHQGATLAVLSMHVDWLYKESSQNVTVIVSTLESILDHAHRTSGKECAPGPEADAWNAGLHASLERIEAAFEGYQGMSGPAQKIVAEQQSVLAGCSAQLNFLSTFNATLTEQIKELSALRRSLSPWLNQPALAARDSTEGLVESYTMQSERDVHARARGVLKPAAIAAGPALAAIATNFWRALRSRGPRIILFQSPRRWKQALRRSCPVPLRREQRVRNSGITWNYSRQ